MKIQLNGKFKKINVLDGMLFDREYPSYLQDVPLKRGNMKNIKKNGKHFKDQLTDEGLEKIVMIVQLDLPVKKKYIKIQSMYLSILDETSLENIIDRMLRTLAEYLFSIKPYEDPIPMGIDIYTDYK